MLKDGTVWGKSLLDRGCYRVEKFVRRNAANRIRELAGVPSRSRRRRTAWRNVTTRSRRRAATGALQRKGYRAALGSITEETQKHRFTLPPIIVHRFARLSIKNALKLIFFTAILQRPGRFCLSASLWDAPQKPARSLFILLSTLGVPSAKCRRSCNSPHPPAYPAAR